VDRDDALPEPSLHLAECLRRAGDPAAAEEVLRESLEAHSTRCPALWSSWIEVVFRDLGRQARDALESLPLAVDGRAVDAASHGGDVLWVLERLAAGEPVRINCGGDDYEAHDGTLWSRDRFYSSASDSFLGRVYFGEINGTDDDPLYQTERVFPGDAMPPFVPRAPAQPSLHRQGDQPPSYRIPLPRGSYEVELHFAEVFEPMKHTPGRRRSFAIEIEGTTVRDDYEPMANGFAAASRITSATSVEDGFLEIRLIQRLEFPKISAIAVRRID
jgi:hypothetical protein